MSNTYQINKGIGKPVEFQGLKAQYIFYLAAGLIAIFMLFIFMRLIGVEAIISMPLVGLVGGFLIYYTFYLNKKYGQHGLMKLMAKGKRPAHLVNLGYKNSSFFCTPKKLIKKPDEKNS